MAMVVPGTGPLLTCSPHQASTRPMHTSPPDQTTRLDAFMAATWPDRSDAFPPPLLLSKVLAKIEECGIMVIMVTPRWVTPLWCDRLRHMAIGDTVNLGGIRDTCQARPGARLPRMGALVATLMQGTRVINRRL